MPRKPSIEIERPARGQIFRRLDDGTYVFWFDHHLINQFTTCPTYFNYRTMQSLRPKGGVSAAISIGQWWSSVMEYFYTLRPQNEPFTYLDIVACAGKAWVTNNMDDLAKRDPEKYEKFAMPVTKTEISRLLGNAAAEGFFQLYSERAKVYREAADLAAPEDVQVLLDKAEQLEKTTKFPLGPVLMAAKYFNTYAAQDAQNWKVIAAERAYGAHGEVMVGEERAYRPLSDMEDASRIIVFYMGKPDLVVFEPKTGLLMPVDHKTKDTIPYNVEVIWKPHPQTAGYIYAVREIAEDLGYDKVIVDRCVINVATRLEPGPKAKNQQRFRRVLVHYSESEIEEWRTEIMAKAWQLRDAIENNQFIRRESACHLYAGCEFRGVCSQPPQNRELVIKSDFKKAEPWSPYDEDEA
jgi:hypothetical protein